MLNMHPLDNPAWSALTTEQATLARGTPIAKRYNPGVLSFAGLAQPDAATAEGLDPFIGSGESFYIIGDLPPLPAAWRLEHGQPCAQLLAPVNLNCMPQPTETISLLGEPDKDDMYRLINSVQPGYYLHDTWMTGDYCGIRRDGRLVAMAGERIRMTGFSELSAICTHPEYTGRGYAQQLIGWLCRREATAVVTPFLHVSLANQRALRLYLHLGFRHRREIVFHRIQKTG